MIKPEEAEEIMGRNYFGPIKARQLFETPLTQKGIEILSNVPHGEDELERFKHTHILIAQLSISVVEMYRIIEERIPFVFPLDTPWILDERFARTVNPRPQWMLVAKKPLKDSKKKTWAEQRAILDHLGPRHCVPNLNTLLYTMIGYFLETGEELFRDELVRCKDIDRHNLHVCVGHFRKDCGIWLPYSPEDSLPHDPANPNTVYQNTNISLAHAYQ